MSYQLLTSNPASAYDSLAPYYDQFTAGYDHERWIGGLDRLATSLGQRGWRALDIGCGTGKSTAALLERGYSVLGCDISPQMLRIARAKSPAPNATYLLADMRDLPALGQFDLILCLDDAVNYLLSDGELKATFAGVARLLAPEGMFVFDVNSLKTYRGTFANVMVRESPGMFFAWRGETSAAFQPGERATATVEVFAEDPRDGSWNRSSSRHIQRHHRDATILRALRAGGLQCRAVVGQSPGAELEPTIDEERHIKLVYFAGRVTPRSRSTVN